MHRTIITRAGLAGLAAAALALGACSDDDSAGIDAGASAEITTEAATGDAAGTATSEDGSVTVTVDPATDLQDGQRVAIDITGADPEMGYYVAVCTGEKQGPVPVCIGDRDAGGTQLWITNKYEDGTIPEDGHVTDELTVTRTGRSEDGTDIDCAAEECTLKVFGDHANGFVDVADVPLTFAE
ncbi:hypothetical protein CSPHI_08140 [Corynebacterium sphenisci DSM 44792]|uniref:Thiamine biosynthesis protein n=1 Tax=Corynebacterium sphenisci DSM 44792 TaxID=1437874 RepID=A0A1L7CYZ6_9CORY|nr:neocarzinostatin apoprotein domain-containing protein [Corynebacterium sphenisci]APT91013.1 hypothetical protein CSPHI_08140 [Corynebacterium sphenisci DSM 44792]